MNSLVIVMLTQSTCKTGVFFGFLCLGYFFAPGSFTKILPILFLALNSVCLGNDYGGTIGLGLILSAIGDVALENCHEGNDNNFILGLVFFLFAHVNYILAFWANCRQFSILAIGTALSYYFAIMHKLWPSLHTPAGEIIDLTVPVIIYASVISTMLALAILRAFSYDLGVSYNSKLYALVGACVFVASDSIIALDKFHSTIHNAKLYIMITYYLGQFLIAASVWSLDNDWISQKVQSV